MTAKTSKHPVVEFLASTRLAPAYRAAARRNKRLARCSAMHELGQAGVRVAVAAPELVVLSHAEDDERVLSDERVAPVVSKAFHLMFTEPSTHPDQVAQWMRVTNIRAENRLHVVRVQDLEAPQVSELLGRVCFALGSEGSCGSIIDAYLAGDTLFVRGPKHRMLHVPVSALGALRDQPQAILRNFQVDPDGAFIHWPDLDVHLGWNQFLQAVDPEELRKAQQRSAGFNQRYGAAIRRVRENAGIRQSQIKGLTERQLRRIEQGECRVTSTALTALAKAHGLDANGYMDRLAQTMAGIMTDD